MSIDVIISCSLISAIITKFKHVILDLAEFPMTSIRVLSKHCLEQ